MAKASHCSASLPGTMHSTLEPEKNKKHLLCLKQLIMYNLTPPYLLIKNSEQ